LPNYEKAAERAARRYGLNPRIFKAMIRQESGFNPNARSGAGAQGIAQFMPATAREYGVNLNDNRASDDLDGAARYLKANLDKYGSYHKALSVYNSGRPDAYKDPSFAQGQTYNYVKGILGSAGEESVSGRSRPSQGAPSRQSGSPAVYQRTQGVDNSQARQQLAAEYFANSHDPGALLAYKSGVDQAQDVPGSLKMVQPGMQAQPTTSSGDPRTDRKLQRIKAEADLIDAAKVPYLWGGGHAVKQKRGSKVTPLDCSGAVSRVLGIDPRVSGQFESWGRAGRAKGGKGVTVYANDHHVLMEINGHFFGTSDSNPGGGAGWIKRKDISAAYLKGFTARHL